MKVLVALIGILLFIIGPAQIQIEGNAPGFKNKFVSLLTIDDYISYSYKTISKHRIDSTGKFHFEVNTDKAFRSIIEIEDKSAILYIDPSTSSYKIHFPSIQESDHRMSGNNIQLIFEDLPKDDLNTLILEFNLRFDDFLYGDTTSMMRLVMQNNVFKDSLDVFKKSLLQHYKDIDNEYFLDYMRYSVASVEQLSTGNDIAINRLFVFNNYLKDRPVLYHNDAYMTFFNQFYENILKSPVKGDKDRLYIAINNNSSKTELADIFQQDVFLKNEQVKEIAMIKGVAEEYYSGSFVKENLITILETIAQETAYLENRKIANNAIKVITKLEKGFPAPEFYLTNLKNDTVSLARFKRKYIYLNFFATWNDVSTQEMDIIEGLEDKYGKYIEFISICIDKDEKAFTSYLNDHPKYKWNIVHYQGEVGLLTDYRLTSIPDYFLIDQEGNILQAPAYKPTPNNNYQSIDKTFFDIKKKLDPKNKTQIGGKN